MFLNLAQGIPRQVFDNVKRPGNFERCQAFAATLFDLCGVDRRSSDQVGHRHLAPQLIRTANNRRLSHFGLFSQEVLDFARIDIEAP